MQVHTSRRKWVAQWDFMVYFIHHIISVILEILNTKQKIRYPDIIMT